MEHDPPKPEADETDTIKRARKFYQEEGELEFDDFPEVSRAEGNPEHGAYVAAWVWIRDTESE